jgi:sulfite exporter TauE/SafE
VWGWMPCGFVYTVLVIATLQLDALAAAATMIAFGLGTAPAMIATALGARHLTRYTAGASGKRVAGAVLVASAALTRFAPWLADHAPWLHAWLPWLCSTGT